MLLEERSRRCKILLAECLWYREWLDDNMRLSVFINDHNSGFGRMRCLSSIQFVEAQPAAVELLAHWGFVSTPPILEALFEFAVF